MNIWLAQQFGTLNTLLDFETVEPAIPAQARKLSSAPPASSRVIQTATRVGESMAREFIKRSMAPHRAGVSTRARVSHGPSKESAADDSEDRREGDRWGPEKFLSRMSPRAVLEGEVTAHALRDLPFGDRVAMLADSRERQADPLYQNTQRAKALGIAAGAGGLGYFMGPSALHFAVSKSGWDPEAVNRLATPLLVNRVNQVYDAVLTGEALKNVKGVDIATSDSARRVADAIVSGIQADKRLVFPEGVSPHVTGGLYLRSNLPKARNAVTAAASMGLLDAGLSPQDAARVLLDPNEKGYRPGAFLDTPKGVRALFQRATPKLTPGGPEAKSLLAHATAAREAQHAAAVIADQARIPRTVEGAILRAGRWYGKLDIPGTISAPLGFGASAADATTGLAGVLKKRGITNRLLFGLAGASAAGAYSLPRLRAMADRAGRPRDMESLADELRGDDQRAEAIEYAAAVESRMAAERNRAAGKLTVSPSDFASAVKSKSPLFYQGVVPTPGAIDAAGILPSGD
jgi:hypothetical protein